MHYSYISCNTFSRDTLFAIVVLMDVWDVYAHTFAFLVIMHKQEQLLIDPIAYSISVA